MIYPLYFNSLTRLRGLARAGSAQFLGESKWHLLYFGVLCIMGVVGFVVSPYHSKSRLAFLLMGLATYGVTVALIDSPRRLWQAFGLFSLFGLTVTLVGAAGTDWATYKLPAISTLTGFIPRAPAQFLSVMSAPGGIHPNEVAGMLTLYVPPLLGVVLFGGRAALFTPPLRVSSILIVTVLSLMAIYLALSLSRASLLGLGVAVILLLWMRRRAWGVAALVAIPLVVLGLYFFLPNGTLVTLLSSAVAKTFTGSGETRTEIWRQAVQAIANAPLTGIGLYNFGAIFRYNVYLPPGWPFPIVHAHNAFLQAALDLGLPGAIAYALLLADVAWHALRVGRRLEGAAAGVCYGLGAAVLAFGVFGVFDTIQLTSPVAWLTWFVIGMAGAAARVGDRFTAYDPLFG
jgi:putative inorganic carbon (hco3(-)) transporter